MINSSTFVSNETLAQSAERGASKGKVVCSRLIPGAYASFSAEGCFLSLSGPHVSIP